jgi:signal transduction histidine kinase
MMHDWPWIWITIFLDSLVVVGYVLIARHWFINEKKIEDGPAKTALKEMKYIFLFCCFCGYLFPIIRMGFPIVRLADLALVFLIYFTWSYTLRSAGLNVVYNELRSNQMLKRQNTELTQETHELERAKKDLQNLADQLNVSLEKAFTINTELTRSNEELEQFAYVASHDLKAPLRAVHNLANWIEEDVAEGKNVKDNMEKLKTRISHMDRLIDGLLEFSRIGRTHTEKKDVDVVNLLQSDVLPMLPSDRIEIKIDPLPIVKANPVRLGQVFSNLIGNSISHAEKPLVHVRIHAREAENFYEFCVEDDGPGIDPRFHEKIFAIFQTLKPKLSGGTGIGLTLVEKIIKELGGEVWVQSELGAGAKFFFTVPK